MYRVVGERMKKKWSLGGREDVCSLAANGSRRNETLKVDLALFL